MPTRLAQRHPHSQSLEGSGSQNHVFTAATVTQHQICFPSLFQRLLVAADLSRSQKSHTFYVTSSLLRLRNCLAFSSFNYQAVVEGAAETQCFATSTHTANRRGIHCTAETSNRARFSGCSYSSFIAPIRRGHKQDVSAQTSQFVTCARSSCRGWFQYDSFEFLTDWPIEKEKL